MARVRTPYWFLQRQSADCRKLLPEINYFYWSYRNVWEKKTHDFCVSMSHILVLSLFLICLFPLWHKMSVFVRSSISGYFLTFIWWLKVVTWQEKWSEQDGEWFNAAFIYFWACNVPHHDFYHGLKGILDYNWLKNVHYFYLIAS